MRRLRTVLLVLAGAFTLTVSASAIVGIPEIDKANADIRLSAKPAFTVTRCAGEDGISYLTYLGGWSGTEADVTPGSTDYTLSGAITVRNVVWTITPRHSAAFSLAAPFYCRRPVPARQDLGDPTLITQRIPNVDVSASARGWLTARTYTNGTADGGSLLANIELTISNTFTAIGGSETRRRRSTPRATPSPPRTGPADDAVCGKPIGEPHCRLRCGNECNVRTG